MSGSGYPSRGPGGPRPPYPPGIPKARPLSTNLIENSLFYGGKAALKLPLKAMSSRPSPPGPALYGGIDTQSKESPVHREPPYAMGAILSPKVPTDGWISHRPVSTGISYMAQPMQPKSAIQNLPKAPPKEENELDFGASKQARLAALKMKLKSESTSVKSHQPVKTWATGEPPFLSPAPSRQPPENWETVAKSAPAVSPSSFPLRTPASQAEQQSSLDASTQRTYMYSQASQQGNRASPLRGSSSGIAQSPTGNVAAVTPPSFSTKQSSKFPPNRFPPRTSAEFMKSRPLVGQALDPSRIHRQMLKVAPSVIPGSVSSHSSNDYSREKAVLRHPKMPQQTSSEASSSRAFASNIHSPDVFNTGAVTTGLSSPEMSVGSGQGPANTSGAAPNLSSVVSVATTPAPRASDFSSTTTSLKKYRALDNSTFPRKSSEVDFDAPLSFEQVMKKKLEMKKKLGSVTAAPSSKRSTYAKAVPKAKDVISQQVTRMDESSGTTDRLVAIQSPSSSASDVTSTIVDTSSISSPQATLGSNDLQKLFSDKKEAHIPKVSQASSSQILGPDSKVCSASYSQITSVSAAETSIDAKLSRLPEIDGETLMQKDSTENTDNETQPTLKLEISAVIPTTEPLDDVLSMQPQHPHRDAAPSPEISSSYQAVRTQHGTSDTSDLLENPVFAHTLETSLKKLREIQPMYNSPWFKGMVESQFSDRMSQLTSVLETQLHSSLHSLDDIDISLESLKQLASISSVEEMRSFYDESITFGDGAASYDDSSLNIGAIENFSVSLDARLKNILQPLG